MEGKIDKNGWLQIIRAGKFTKQACPFDTGAVNGGSSDCGHWCPLFGEPRAAGTMAFDGLGQSFIQPTGKTHLDICQERTLLFDKFTDEREK